MKQLHDDIKECLFTKPDTLENILLDFFSYSEYKMYWSGEQEALIMQIEFQIQNNNK